MEDDWEDAEKYYGTPEDEKEDEEEFEDGYGYFTPVFKQRKILWDPHGLGYCVGLSERNMRHYSDPQHPIEICERKKRIGNKYRRIFPHRYFVDPDLIDKYLIDPLYKQNERWRGVQLFFIPIPELIRIPPKKRKKKNIECR